MKQRIAISICTAAMTLLLYPSMLSGQTLVANGQGMQGMNWSNSTSNATGANGDGLAWPDGVTGTETYAEAYAEGQTVGNAVLGAGGHTIRMPITSALTTGTPWSTYQGVINGVTSTGATVILCWWAASGNNVSDTTAWYAMWTAVNNVYGSTMSVRYEPINEPAAYSASDLNNLYATFLTTYNLPNYKCILDGTGYASSVTTVGADSRLANQMLGQHVYSWYWGEAAPVSGASWQGYYNAVASAVGAYAWRTVITEIGVQTDGRNPAVPFWQQWDFNGLAPDQAVLSGGLAWARDNGVATIAWSGINNTDLYHWFYSFTNLTEPNPQVADLFRWSWGQPTHTYTMVTAGTYRLQNRGSSEYMDDLGATSNGAYVAQWSSSTSNNQKWQLASSGSVWWQLKNVATGEYVDGLGSTSNGSPLAQWSSSGSTNQAWALEYTSSGYYKLINRTTGLCADNDGLTGSGTYLQQWGSDTSNNQLWSFTQ